MKTGVATILATLSTAAATNYGTCYLKYSAEGSERKTGVTSCILNRESGNCSYVADHDIQNSAGGKVMDTQGAESCCAECKKDVLCKAAVMVKNPNAGTTCSSNIADTTDPSPNHQECEGFKSCGYNCGVSYTYPTDFNTRIPTSGTLVRNLTSELLCRTVFRHTMSLFTTQMILVLPTGSLKYL
eukprot:TRINITY_DN432_c0_g1_i2.p1 TRINITY_DN432_c0_g1~~TRINITY_DN432_c0_g1_i2.p1  ORF type:complete len:203 (+),score=50.58 TRINITY_DN432_c0_g1_i2:56-610(+)